MYSRAARTLEGFFCDVMCLVVFGKSWSVFVSFEPSLVSCSSHFISQTLHLNRTLVPNWTNSKCISTRIPLCYPIFTNLKLLYSWGQQNCGDSNFTIGVLNPLSLDRVLYRVHLKYRSWGYYHQGGYYHIYHLLTFLSTKHNMSFSQTHWNP